MSETNLVAYAAQVAIIVLVCAGLPRVLKLRSPGVQYAFWRALLLVCLMLPLVQPRQAGQMAFSPAPVQPLPASGLTPNAAVTARLPSPPGFNWIAAAQIVIPIGIVARFGWIGLGLVRLRRLRRRATDPATGFEDLQDTIGTTPRILWSAEVRHPVTFGVRKPVVLLPIALKSAEVAAQRAVVAHELHHVKRRDWGWVVAEEMIRSVFWFHPAMWWLVSRVQLARETVVDELSILVTNARRTYLDTLLAFADDTGLASSPAFSARRHLFHRVMLLSKEGEMTSIRVALGSCVLVLALGAGSWGAVTAFPLYGAPNEEQAPRDPQRPPRDPISADAHHRAALEYWEKVTLLDTTLSEAEKRRLILSGVAAEDRALAIQPDFVPALTYKNILLRMQANLTVDVQERNNLLTQADALRSKVIALKAAQEVMVFSPAPRGASGGVPGGVPSGVSGGVPGGVPDGTRLDPQHAGVSGGVGGGVPGGVAGRVAAGQSDALTAADAAAVQYYALVDQYKPLRIGGGIKAPAKTRDVRPVYPPIAQSAKVQGVVILEAIIDANGQVVDAKILRSIPLLDQAAYDAVKQWEFTPTLLNGVPTPVIMTVTVNFVLQ
jgi:TonB family protein